MTGTNHAWVWIGYVTTDDGPAAAFAIDERQYPDAASARAAADEAAEELRRRRLAYEFQSVRVRLDEPAQPLPTWTEYRSGLPAEPPGD